MSIVLPRHHATPRAQRLIKWQKPWVGTLPETSLYAMLFLWIGSEHSFTVAGVIAGSLAIFFCFLPR